VTKSEINMAAGGRLVTGLLGTGGGAGPTDYKWTPGAGTVELNANNTLPTTVWTNFNNLTLSGATTTTLAANLAIGGKLDIGPAAVMNLGTFANSTANSLWFGGVQQAAGVWGPVGSGAAHESARFTGTAGRMTVLTAPPPVTLGFQFSGSNLQLTWSQGTLLEAANVTGPWATNNVATPPSFIVSPTGAGKFYRVQVP
jgi:hypothetical protein